VKTRLLWSFDVGFAITFQIKNHVGQLLLNMAKFFCSRGERKGIEEGERNVI
jgi:hypothetical protein